jgi:hypothetical protein
MVLFWARDPLGNEMRLYEETWHEHVVGEGHPEMGPHLALVEDAVNEPDEVWTSKATNRRIIYYRRVPDRPPLEVAVVGDLRRGIICTAYLFAPRGSRGAERLWPH